MTALTPWPAQPGRGPAVLAADLRALADYADQAGRYAEGSWLIQGDRANELRAAETVAARVLDRLKQLLPDIETHGGERDGVRIAMRAAHDLADGRDTLHHAAVENGAEFAAGTAGSLFRNAAAGARAIAEIAEFRSLPTGAVDDAVRLLREQQGA
ncbi:MAG: hypothetical protein JWO69_1442 [Thermoleophilia bacterium]|jgi:hypothetical protein|nr:hypothetical protein [Thermoleophilia bacterium]